jgi:hypothetical protein
MRTRYMLRQTLAEVGENCERHRLPPCSIARIFPRAPRSQKPFTCGGMRMVLQK